VPVLSSICQRYTPPAKHAAKCQHSEASFDYPHGKREANKHTRTVESAVYEARKRGKLPPERIGFPQDDKRSVSNLLHAAPVSIPDAEWV
jgi:hypothetical protein